MKNDLQYRVCGYKRRRPFFLVLAAALLVPWGVRAAAFWRSETDAIANELMGRFGESLDRKISGLEAEIAALPEGDGGADVLKKTLDEAKKARNYYGAVETGVALYSSAKDIKEALAEISKAAGNTSMGSISPELLVASELKGLKTLKAIESVNSGLDYYQKLVALKKDVEKIAGAELSAPTRRLVAGLSVMTRIMNEYAGSIPLVGDIIQGYGEVGGGMMDAVLELNKTLLDRQQGLLMVAGNTGLYGEMARALPQCSTGDQEASAVDGLPGVFKSACHLLIWDGEKREFVIASDSMPGLSLDAQVVEMRDRHLRFIRNGVVAPTPDQLTKRYDQMVVLRAQTTQLFVGPNQKVQLTAEATLLKDDTKVELPLKVRWANRESLLYTGPSGTFVTGPTPQLNKPVVWVSPQMDGGHYVVEVTLDDERMQALRPATLQMQIGALTRLDLQWKPGLQTVAGGILEIQAALQRQDGTPLSTKEVLGDIQIFCDSCGDTAVRTFAHSAIDKRIQYETWRMPSKPGNYAFMVQFDGSGYGKYGYAATRAGFEVTVVSPAFELSAETESAQANMQTPAVYPLLVTNRDSFPINIYLMMAAQRTDRENWRVEMPTETLSLNPGESRAVQLVVQPKNEDAKFHRVRVWAYAGVPLSVAEMKNLGQMREFGTRNYVAGRMMEPTVGPVAWRFDSLSLAGKTRAQALHAIDERLAALQAIEVAQQAAAARIPKEVDEIVNSIVTLMAESSDDVGSSLLREYAEKWYPAWKRMAQQFAADGLTNGTRTGNAALKSLNPKANPELVIRPDNGLGYYRLLTGMYYCKMEQQILAALKNVIEQHMTDAMPDTLRQQYESDLSKRRLVSNGDGGEFAGLGNWLKIEEEVYRMLAVAPVPETAAGGEKQSAKSVEVSAGDFLGKWTGKGVMRLDRRLSPEKAVFIQIVQKGGEMQVVIDEMKIAIPVQQDGLKILGGKSQTERLEMTSGNSVIRARNYQMNSDLQGEMSADKTSMTLTAVYSMLDMVFHHRMALVREGSTAALPPIPADDNPPKNTENVAFSSVYRLRDAHSGQVPSVAHLFAASI